MTMGIGRLVKQYQVHVAAQPERFRTAVSASLDDLCARLGEEVHGTEQLVVDDPGIVQSELHRSLRELADRLAWQDRHDDELLARRIVLDLCETRDELRHARALSDLAVPLTVLGRLEEAVAARRQAFRVLCELAGKDISKWLDVALEAEPCSDLLVRTGDAALATEVCRQTVQGLAPLAESGLFWAQEPFARCLLRLAERVAEDGDPEEGIRLAQESAEQFGALGGGRDLARALDALSGIKAHAGDLPGALEAALDALVQVRSLSDRDRMALAAALQTAGLRHADLGQWEQAHDHLVEAGELFAELSDEDPSVAPRYAALLAELSAVQARFGRAEAAVESAERATLLHRDLARQNPAAYQKELALGLVNLSRRLAGTGQHAKAVYALRESVKHYRRLRETSQEWTPDLARSHHYLGEQLAELGRHEPALEETRTAVGLYRECASPDLGIALKELGTRLHNLGRAEESTAATGEAIEVFRASGDLPGLANALYNLTVTHNVADQIDDAVRSGTEAVEVYQRMYDEDSDWAAALANALGLLGAAREAAGQVAHAITSVERAVSLLERLHTPGDDEFGPGLARALHNLSRHHEKEGRLERSLEHMRRSVALYGELTQRDPDRFRRRLASSWLSLGIYLSRLGEAEEARSATALAVDLNRQAGARENLALALFQLSSRDAALGRTDECLASLVAATEIYEELALVQPDPYLANLAMSLEKLAACHSEQDDHARALPMLERAADIREPLGDKDSLTGNLRQRLFVQSCLEHDVEETVERLIDIQHDLARTVRTLDGVVQELIGVELLDVAQQLLARASGLWEIHRFQQPDAEPLPNISLLDSHATILSRNGQYEEAAAAQRHAVELLESLAQEEPDGYLDGLAVFRARLSRYLRAADRHAEALDHQRQAVETYEKLAAFDPGTYRPALVSSLTDLGRLLRDLGSSEADVVLARAETLRLTLPDDE
jgi:tetratricopeptide (TPR) repeat protein